MGGNSHDDLIRDQFTRQAIPFNTAAPISDENALARIVAAARPSSNDDVLDLACGGGLIVCAFAPHVRHATGIDMTPAMIERHARWLPKSAWKTSHGSRATCVLCLGLIPVSTSSSPVSLSSLRGTARGIARDDTGLSSRRAGRRGGHVCVRGEGEGRGME